MHRSLSLLLLSFAALALQAQHTPENEKNPLAGDPVAITAGQKLFGQACQSCHGGNAAGSERGPALSTGAFRRGAKDGEIFLNIRNGIAGTQMPPFSGLPVEQAWQIVSYLRSLNSGRAVSGEKVAGNAAQGETLFFGKANCAGCHEVSGRGGIAGPDLSGAAASSAEALREQIVKPKSTSGTVSVTMKDGRQLRGVPRHEDTFSLLLMDPAGKMHRLDKAVIATRRDDAASLMPANYATRLAPAEIQNLIAYLKTLNGRDYAKTVQAPLTGGLTYERIRDAAAEPHNWLTYWGDYQGRHFSALKQITPANVKQLQVKWAVQMPGDYDESTLRSYPTYTGGPPEARAKRDLLRAVMERQGFTVEPNERWHFNYKDWPSYPILDISFAQAAAAKR